MLTVILAGLFATLDGNASGPVHNGRQRQLDIQPPRIVAEARIDGVLDEPVWQQASLLTGFSRYAPVDGVAADDSTEVLVWYSPTAMHFGIRAFAAPGTVNATLADRDRIYSDDYIGIFLATYNDGRQATVFATNPLGVQGDGVVVERGNAGGGFSGLQTGREATDVSPDFVFQSKGRLTDYGYEVEIRIPFKSLRFQAAEQQTWGINVLRRVQSRGYEYSWAPAERAAASYIGQFGKLQGLRGLERSRVLDINPVVTARSTGVMTPSGFERTTKRPDLGGNVRWGITNDATVNGTINPDFAEVESDAGQLVIDPRRALFFAERRPFFLDGIEQFTVPNSLIYTRRIADPVAAVKFTGRRGRSSVALLTAVDGKPASATRDEYPVFNILRAQQDIGKSSRAGLVYTDRIDGRASNRVLATDARFVWNNIYSAQAQAAVSHTAPAAADAFTGTLTNLSLRRAGRTFGARWAFATISDRFRTQSGYINRGDNAHVSFDHSYAAYGSEGSLVQSATFDVVLDGLWRYAAFTTRGDMLERKLHFNNNVALRGGWQAGVSVLTETFGYDDELYAGVFALRPRGAAVDTVAFSGRPRIANLDYVASVTTPNFKQFSGNVQYVWGVDENFYEWAPSRITFLTANLNWRPTDKLRVAGTYNWQSYRRDSDRTLVGETTLPRIKIEYQVNRAIFVRAVAQYTADFADDLVETDRADAPLYRATANGLVRARGYSLATARENYVNEFRPELLFSYLPSPGTVLYAGYGGAFGEQERFGFGRGEGTLTRRSDGLFLKMSYLLRR